MGIVSKHSQLKWKQSLKGISYGKKAISDSRSQKKEYCQGTCGKGWSIVRSFSKAQYPTAPQVKNLDTKKVEAWHTSNFQKWKEWFSKKIIEKQSL